MVENEGVRESGAPGASIPARLATSAPDAAISRRSRSGTWLAYGDVMRVLGIGAVVLQHVCQSVAQQHEAALTTEWWTATLLIAGTKWAVPMFVMLSGALLLSSDRHETAAAFYHRRLSRVGIPTAFWSAFYLLAARMGGTQDHSMAELLDRLVRGVPFYHMFFMFVMIGLYVFTPMIRAFTRHVSRTECAFATGAALLLACCGNAVGHWKGYEPNAFTLFVPYIGFFLAGYCLRDVRLSRSSMLAVAIAFVISVLVTAIGTGLLASLPGANERSRYLLTYFSPFVITTSLAAFLIISNTFRSPAAPVQWAQRLMLRASAATFGIYLIHPFVFRVAERLGTDVLIPSVWLRVPAAAGAILLISWAATELMGRLPWMRRIAGYQLAAQRSCR